MERFLYKKNTIILNVYTYVFSLLYLFINSDKQVVHVEVLWLDLLMSIWIVLSGIEGLISPLLVQVQLFLP